MKIGVVGAGISGLAISLAAEKAGHEVVIFESESDIGGRMSSIRFGSYIIDIGDLLWQFMKVSITLIMVDVYSS